ncbi:hypothetical protein MHYP_G00290500 [Metynnis hypsauchen]
MGDEKLHFWRDCLGEGAQRTPHPTLLPSPHLRRHLSLSIIWLLSQQINQITPARLCAGSAPITFIQAFASAPCGSADSLGPFGPTEKPQCTTVLKRFTCIYYMALFPAHQNSMDTHAHNQIHAAWFSTMDSSLSSVKACKAFGGFSFGLLL